MEVISWNDTLSVKINSIDAQHKKLVELINTFYENIQKGSTKGKLLELIDALKQYTVYHFSTEERYMMRFNFPEYKNHKQEHDKFVETVLDFEKRYKNGKLILTVEITNFIKEWVTNHIKGTDKKYSDLLIKNGVK